nr:5125_t:CDS:2 [Entrophospora candida]
MPILTLIIAKLIKISRNIEPFGSNDNVPTVGSDPHWPAAANLK